MKRTCAAALSLFLACVALLAPSHRVAVQAGSQEPSNFFPLIMGPVAHPHLFLDGVASGDVTAGGAVLWTRVEGGSELALDVALDSTFDEIVFARTVQPRAEDDFTVKVDVSGLAPGTRYYYRWRSYGPTSPTGVFHTAPQAAASASLRFAFGGDSDGTLVEGQPVYNQFQSLAAAAAASPDFFLYVGDTIYSDSYYRSDGPAQTLEAYRQSYRTNRRQQALTDLLAATSTYALWDDHEVYNDYDGQTVNIARFASGSRAFYEYMPLREAGLLEDGGCAGAPLFRVYHWGSYADVIILDTRPCRSADVAGICTASGADFPDLAPTLPAAARLAAGLPATPPVGCRDAINDPTRTMLGGAQKAALKDALLHSQARYQFVVTQQPIQQLYLYPYDRWEGYAAERTEILHFLRDNHLENVIFLAADVHANMMNQVFVDHFTEPASLAYEFVSGPIAAATFENEIRVFDGEQVLVAINTLFDVLGMDCRHLDSYGYGWVELDAAGEATISLRDDSGALLSDQSHAAVTCSRSFAAATE